MANTRIRHTVHINFLNFSPARYIFYFIAEGYGMITSPHTLTTITRLHRQRTFIRASRLQTVLKTFAHFVNSSAMSHNVLIDNKTTLERQVPGCVCKASLVCGREGLNRSTKLKRYKVVLLVIDSEQKSNRNKKNVLMVTKMVIGHIRITWTNTA